jgi:hypothetical protein
LTAPNVILNIERLFDAASVILIPTALRHCRNSQSVGGAMVRPIVYFNDLDTGFWFLDAGRITAHTPSALLRMV